MATLITGGTGFLGSHVARHLVMERAEEVVLFDRYPARERLGAVAELVTVVEGDVLDVEHLRATLATRAVDRVVHLAFMPGTAHPERIPAYAELTCVGTANVFDAARLEGVPRVVNASSMAVYGDADAAELTEDAHARPVTLYGMCKLWTEQLGSVYNREHGMEILSLRVCATMGVGRLNRASLAAGLMGEEVVHFMAAPELAALGHPVELPPDDQLTEVLYAADAADAFWLALSAPRPEHSVFNLTGGRRPVGDLRRHLRRLLPDARISVSDRPGPRNPLLSAARLHAELGFEPRYSLEAALEAYVGEVLAAAG